MSGTTPILTLRICNIGFRKLAKGEIAYKYREVKPFRTSRLLNEKGEPKYFEEIHIKNGYQPNSPVAIYGFGGVIGEEVHEGKLCYKIKLGKLKEIKNFKE